MTEDSIAFLRRCALLIGLYLCAACLAIIFTAVGGVSKVVIGLVMLFQLIMLVGVFRAIRRRWPS